MRDYRLVFSTLLVAFLCATALGSDGTALNWTYRWTAYVAAEPHQDRDTAVALRDGRVWPATFMDESTQSGDNVSTISLWHTHRYAASTGWPVMGWGLNRYAAYSPLLRGRVFSAWIARFSKGSIDVYAKNTSSLKRRQCGRS